MTDTVTPPQPAPVVREWATDKRGIALAPLKDLTIRELVAEHNTLARAYLALRIESDARLASWAECRDLLSKARAEVERLKTNGELLLARASLAELRAEAAEARAAKLLEALEKYGRHKSICGSRDYAERLADKYCDCGLAAAKGETV